MSDRDWLASGANRQRRYVREGTDVRCSPTTAAKGQESGCCCGWPIPRLPGPPAGQHDLLHRPKQAPLRTVRQAGDYDVRRDTPPTPPGTLPPILVMGSATIENTSWQQYASDGRTRIKVNDDGSCDCGLLPINAANTQLFTYRPALLSDTVGNVAAGGHWLREKLVGGQELGFSLLTVASIALGLGAV